MNRNLTILIIEDSGNDVLLLKLALKRAGVANPIQVVQDGQEAIDYLQGAGPYADRAKHPFPSLVITDLKMPRKSGFEVLEWLRSHPECSVIPVIILSASRQDADIKRAYEMSANSHLARPATIDELKRMMRLMFEYWQACEKLEHPERC